MQRKTALSNNASLGRDTLTRHAWLDDHQSNKHWWRRGERHGCDPLLGNPDMDFIFNARLRRGQYWLSMIGITVGLIVVLPLLMAAGIVPGGAGLGAVSFLLLIPATGWAIAARARDAGRNVVGWTLAGLFLPFCWIIVGCFGSTPSVYDRRALLRTFE
jgi:hypothetical protein